MYNESNRIALLSIAGLLTTLLGIAPASANLITNSDFEAGNVGFSSDYLYLAGTNTADAQYTINDNPRSFNFLFTEYGDHTSGSGNMMVVNGSTVAGDVVWQQMIPVSAGASYDFAAYISSAFPTSPADLLFDVNGTTIGTLNAPPTTGVWDLFFATWDSMASTSATISILNNNTAFSGNDFALDDLYFGATIFSNPDPDPDPDPSPVPVPATLALLLLGLVSLHRSGTRVVSKRL